MFNIKKIIEEHTFQPIDMDTYPYVIGAREALKYSTEQIEHKLNKLLEIDRCFNEENQSTVRWFDIRGQVPHVIIIIYSLVVILLMYTGLISLNTALALNISGFFFVVVLSLSLSMYFGAITSKKIQQSRAEVIIPMLSEYEPVYVDAYHYLMKSIQKRGLSNECSQISLSGWLSTEYQVLDGRLHPNKYRVRIEDMFPAEKKA